MPFILNTVETMENKLLKIVHKQPQRDHSTSLMIKEVYSSLLAVDEQLSQLTKNLEEVSERKTDQNYS